MAPGMQNLFDSLDEGLLMVSPKGVVRLANQAAMRLFPVIVGQPLATDEILAQVSAAHRGHVRLPVEFEMAAPRPGASQDRLRVRLMLSPVGGGFLLVVHNQTEALNYAEDMTRLMQCQRLHAVTPAVNGS